MASRVSGGKKLARFLRQAKSAKSVRAVEVGFFSTAKYPDGTSVAAVAAWNEFGTERNGRQHVPERPFFRNAISGAGKVLLPVLVENINPKTMALDRKSAGKVGLAMQSRIQRSITTLRRPENAPATIEAKGSSNPLIRDGVMRKSVDFRVIG